jgi:asparagine synthase (glutamine-hydrolysing)
MFAVAMWDRLSRSLVLVRDPLGIKPLYVSEQQGGIAFSSELKALTRLSDLNFETDPAAVHDIFSFGHVRQPRSIYKQVRQLEPGHYLEIHSSDDAAQTRYWTPKYRIKDKNTPKQWIEEFRERSLASVGRHMLADVPVGVFLSGGIDSSAVTAAMSMISTSPVKAFTIGFPGTRLDETPYARVVAEHFGCEHHVVTVDIKSASEILPRLQGCFDEPFADPAAIPTWYLAELASQHVKVVLTGDGGDELFAGYKRHKTAKSMELAQPLLRPLASAIRPLEAVLRQRLRRVSLLLQRARRYQEIAMLPNGAARFFDKLQISSPRFREELYDPAFAKGAECDHVSPWLEHQGLSSAEDISTDELEQFMLADLTDNLPSALLTKLDRTTMAHSLEARVPFLSHSFVDWAMTMPIGLKLRGGVGKYVVRKALIPSLPPQIVKRGKQGFKVPLSAWFAGGLDRFAREVWNDSGAAQSGFFDKQAFERMVSNHRSGARDAGRVLLAATMFGLWWQNRSCDRLS